MAELADALGSGLSERKLVRVQVPPSALRSTAFGGKANSLKGEFFVVPLLFNLLSFPNLGTLERTRGSGRRGGEGGIIRENSGICFIS